MKTYPLEIIEWWDHTTTVGWTSPSDQKKTDPVKIVSIGQLVQETKQKVVLGMSKDHDDEMFTGAISILKVCIVKRKKFKVSV
jgi:hypothetical protein